MQLENFSGNTREAVRQDFYAHLVMMNILTHYMLDYQQPWNIQTIPEYRLNYTLIFGTMREHLQRSLVGKQSSDQLWKGSFHDAKYASKKDELSTDQR